MPEAPEIRIMSQFFNAKLGTCDVIKVEKSPLSKNQCDLSPVNDGRKWKVFSSFRGKEMMVKLSSGDDVHSLKINFARIGALKTCPVNSLPDDFDKAAVLRFYTDTEILYLYDFTRYSIWRWSDQWDTNRSPDIVVQHNEWRQHLYKHRKIDYFKRPIFDIILDQRFFNGLGNFSRSELLCRTRCSPFMNFNEILESDIMRNDFFEVSKETLDDIARLGGFQFKYWQNPFGMDKKKFNKWVRCYNKFPKTFYQKDSKGRKFWFDKKNLLNYVLWMHGKTWQTTEVQDTRLLEKIYKYNK